MQVDDEIFQRNVGAELSPGRVYDMVYEITGDRGQAEIQKAWRQLALTRS